MKWPKCPWEITSSSRNKTRSDLSPSLRQVAPGFGSDLAVSLREVAPGSFSRLRVMKTRATSPCRSGMVALSIGSDFSTSLWKVAPRCKCVSPDVKTRATLCSRSGWVAPGCGAQRPHAVAPRGRSSSARPKLTLITSFWAPNAPKCLQKLHVVLKYLIETYVCKMQPKHV